MGQEYTLHSYGNTLGTAVSVDLSAGDVDTITFDSTGTTFSGGGSTIATVPGSPLLAATAAANPDFGIADSTADTSSGAELTDGTDFFRHTVTSYNGNIFDPAGVLSVTIPAGSYSLIVVEGYQTVSDVCIDANVEITGGLTINGNPIDAVPVDFSPTANPLPTGNKILNVTFTDTAADPTATPPTPRTIQATVDATELEIEIEHGADLPTPLEFMTDYGRELVAEQLFILESPIVGFNPGLYRYDGDLSDWVLIADNAAAGAGVQYTDQDSLGTGESASIGAGDFLQGADSNLYVNLGSSAQSISDTTTSYSGFTRINPVNIYRMAHTGSTWNVAHNLGQQFVNVTVYDTSETNPIMVIPDEITLTDANNLTINFAGHNVSGMVVVTG